MSDVTVIGLGMMGSALARGFLASGKTVTVWNRSPAKAAPLQQMGALHAPSAAEAVSASPMLVICLSDYAASTMVLDEESVSAALGGRVVVQLSSGTPKQARTFEAFATTFGADCLDGAISASPGQIGEPDATIVVSGREHLFTSVAPLMKPLAGGLTYVGTDIGRSKVLFNAAMAYFAGHWIGFSQGAAICEAEGVDPGEFGEMMASLSPAFGQDMRHMGQVIARGRFGEPESTVKSVSADFARLVELSRDLNIGTAFPTFAADIFRRAADAGFGAEEQSAVIKVLRTT